MMTSGTDERGFYELMIDITVLIESLVVVQAASGIHPDLLQEVGNLVQLLSGDPSDVEQPVTVVIVQQLHDVRKILLTGKVEVHLSQTPVRVAYRSAYAVYNQGFIGQRQVAEACHQHTDEKKARGKGDKGGEKAPPSIDADGVVAQYEEHQEQYEEPEHIERRASVGRCGHFGGSPFAWCIVVKTYPVGNEDANHRRWMTERRQADGFFFSVLQVQRQYARPILSFERGAALR